MPALLPAFQNVGQVNDAFARRVFHVKSIQVNADAAPFKGFHDFARTSDTSLSREPFRFGDYIPRFLNNNLKTRHNVSPSMI